MKQHEKDWGCGCKTIVTQKGKNDPIGEFDTMCEVHRKNNKHVWLLVQHVQDYLKEHDK